MPKGIGTKSNGKLKASEWHSLFSKHLPLIALDVFGSKWSPNDHQRKRLVLENLVSLVECTHFVENKNITEDDTWKFEIDYAKYCKTSATLFPGISIRPNHHYALHIGLSEFGGERLNGMLQSLSNNNLLGQIESSMTKSFCQIQRLSHVKEYTKLTHRQRNKGTRTNLDIGIYEAVLHHLRQDHDYIHDYRNLPHPQDAAILTRDVLQFESLEGSSISTKKPNNGVWWMDDEEMKYGFVIHILQFSIEGVSTRIVIEPTTSVDFARLSEVQAEWPGFLQRMGVGVGEVKAGAYTLVESSKVQGLCAYREMPAWCAGNNHPLILWQALHLDVPSLDPMEGIVSH
ncbi:hypothetical protein DFH28DRAFT_936399 [Melampsora americana]|nr:hypothetical protein DFH28DRAFT_936399 [Melampsora americana]